MSGEPKTTEEENNEFADFMADISQEIAERVQSLEPPAPAAPRRPSKKAAKVEAGVIIDWEEIADRMIEEMR